MHDHLQRPTVISTTLDVCSDILLLPKGCVRGFHSIPSSPSSAASTHWPHDIAVSRAHGQSLPTYCIRGQPQRGVGGRTHLRSFPYRTTDGIRFSRSLPPALRLGLLSSPGPPTRERAPTPPLSRGNPPVARPARPRGDASRAEVTRGASLGPRAPAKRPQIGVVGRTRAVVSGAACRRDGTRGARGCCC